MVVTTLSSREFNQDTGRAKKAAENGPVIITDRGVPAHVLLSIDDYHRLAGNQVILVDELGLPPDIEDVAFDPPTLQDMARPADLA